MHRNFTLQNRQGGEEQKAGRKYPESGSSPEQRDEFRPGYQKGS